MWLEQIKSLCYLVSTCFKSNKNYSFDFESAPRTPNAITRNKIYKQVCELFCFCAIPHSGKKRRTSTCPFSTFWGLVASTQWPPGGISFWGSQNSHTLNHRLDYWPESTLNGPVSLVVIATKLIWRPVIYQWLSNWPANSASCWDWRLSFPPR